MEIEFVPGRREAAMEIVLGTRNKGKIHEIEHIFEDVDATLLRLDAFPPFPEPPEDGYTFQENALAKAKATYEATGLPALADDSGLEVDALGGEPGVLSARYGGEGLTDDERSQKLLEALVSIPAGDRRANFRCVMALYPAPGAERRALVTEGLLYGEIAAAPSGHNGFGYDPVFVVPERGMTLAEMAPEEKNAISHRYRALVEMKYLLMRECGLARRHSGA
jgi:XTP/dITP diphosphohydrolase